MQNDSYFTLIRNDYLFFFPKSRVFLHLYHGWYTD